MTSGRWWIVALLPLLACQTEAARVEPEILGLEPGSHSFEFVDRRGDPSRPIRVRYHQPTGYGPETPIVVVMHGASRAAQRYFDDWQPEAESYGFLLLVPEFSAERYQGSRQYNLGNVFESEDPVGLRPERLWSFSAVGHLVDEVRMATGGRQSGFLLYGHSAGSQFAHRLLWTLPELPVERVVLANAGWYTTPTDTVRWPYGLGGTPFWDGVPTGLARDVVVLLGDQDTDPAASSLRQTPEALAQGPHRFARGHHFFEAARSQARTLGVPFAWQLDTVAGAGHSNAAMAARAAALLMR